MSVAILRGGGDIDEQRWTRMIRSFERSGTTRLLLFLLGTVELGPSKRRKLMEAIGERRVAAIVDSVVGRGVITALSWSGVPIESFSLSHVREGLASLDPEAEGASIEQSFDLAAQLLEATGLAGKLRGRAGRTDLTLRPAGA